MLRTRIRSPSRSAHRSSVISSFRRIENSANVTIFCIGIRGGTLISNTAEVLHQSLELFKRRPTIALGSFFYQSQFLENGGGIVKLLAGKGITPGGPCHCEDV